MIKIPICIYAALFLITYSLRAMDHAEELLNMHPLLARAVNSPTLFDRMLHEAGVPDNQMVHVAQVILVRHQPIPIPFESLNALLNEMLVGNHMRSLAVAAELPCRRARFSQSFLKSKIHKRSE